MWDISVHALTWKQLLIISTEKRLNEPLQFTTRNPYNPKVFHPLGTTTNDSEQSVETFSGVNSCVITLTVNGTTNESYINDTK